MRRMAFSLAALTAAFTASTASAATLFEDGLDSVANFIIGQQADTTVQVVDYSSFSVPNPKGAPVIRSHPEAPRMVAGSASTTGVLFTANDSGTPGLTGVTASASATSIAAFSGTYQVSFDMYLSLGNGVTEFFPESGSTENSLIGVGRANSDALGYNNRNTAGDGTFSWLANENGFGTEDAGIYENTTELADLGDTQPGEAQPFNDAFSTNFGVNDTPANTWVQADIAVEDLGGGISNVRVFYNGVLFFDQNVDSANANGSIVFGYGDPFSSISSEPDFQYGIFDNITVSDTITIPEPASLALLGLGGLAMFRRR